MGRFLKWIAPDTVTSDQVPLSDQTVDVNGENAAVFKVDEAAHESCLLGGQHSVRAFVELVDLLSSCWLGRGCIGCHLGHLFVVEDVLHYLH